MKLHNICLLFILLGCSLLGYGIYKTINQLYFNMYALEGSGIVINATNRPIIEFKTDKNQLIRFSAQTHSNPPPYALGVKVNILYLANNPQQARIDSFTDKWMLSILILIGGLIVFVPAYFCYMMLIKADRKATRLKQYGKEILATYSQTIEVNILQTNNPLYQIYCYWLDPNNPKDMYLYIGNVNKDPRPYITEKQIKEFPVIIDPKNYASYKMDVSFIK